MRKRITTWSLIVCMTVFLTGCGGISQSTPKETLDGFKHAMSNEDWETGFRYLTKGAQDTFLVAMIVGASSSTRNDQEKEKSLEDILKKHGVDLVEMKKPPKLIVINGDASATFSSMVSGVIDKGSCFQAVMKWLKENSQDNEIGFNPADEMKKTTFSEPIIEGNKATATKTVAGKNWDIPITLTKIDSKWYIDMPKLDIKWHFDIPSLSRAERGE